MEEQNLLGAQLDSETYLDTYLPLPSESPSLPERILDSLKTAGVYHNNTWANIPKQTIGGNNIIEEKIYEGLVKVLEGIRALTEQNLLNLNRVPGKWVDTHKIVPQTWSHSRGASDLKPEISFVHNETSNAEVLWSRVYSIIEVKSEVDKVEETDEDRHPAANLGSYVSNIFAEQVDRLFVNALTLSGRKLQISRYDRSGFITLNSSIDIDKDPLKFVQIVASFSYLSPSDLGWDPTCTIWNGEEQIQQPSYELPQKIFQHCGIYDLPWVFKVEKEDYVAIGPVDANRSRSILGRAAFLFHAVELTHWKSKNGQAKVYIFKQCWQRLPRLESEPKSVESRNGDNYTPDQVDRDSLVGQFEDIDGKPFEAFVMDRVGWTDRIRASWNVEIDGQPVTTFQTIRKNLATSLPPPPDMVLDEEGFEVGADYRLQATDQPALVTRTLVRLVFDKLGWPIERFTSKLNLLHSLRMIVTELEALCEKGVVHRDVSPSNLVISDSGGHVIDYDHSIVGFVKGEVVIEKMETENVVEIATKILGDEWIAESYVNRLKQLWRIKLNDRAPTPKDFHWPEQIDPVYVFHNEPFGGGLITGTYEFISPDLRRAPFHHGRHDLDSLWWSINIIPLKFEGPGGRERKNPPRKTIDAFYTRGTENKMQLMGNLAAGSGSDLAAIMAEYSDYFEDLKPFMKKWAFFLPIALHCNSFEHYHPHRYIIKIIDEAIQQMEEKPDKGEAGYETFSAAEQSRRDKEKEEMAEAICNQVTVPELLKFKDTVVAPVGEAFAITPSPNVTNSGYSTATTPFSSERHSISLTTVDSPGRDRAVKRARV